MRKHNLKRDLSDKQRRFDQLNKALILRIESGEEEAMTRKLLQARLNAEHQARAIKVHPDIVKALKILVALANKGQRPCRDRINAYQELIIRAGG